MTRMSGVWYSLLIPSLAVALSIVLGAVIMFVSGYAPLQAYAALFVGAFGNTFNLATTLTNSIPLAGTGLAVALAFRAGLFNIGAEGQYWMGAIAATWAGIHFAVLPPLLHIAFAVLVGMLAGGLWGGLVPGFLKATTGAHEVITTMMMSYIAIFFGHFLLEGGPLMAKGYNPESDPVAASARLPILVAHSQLSAGLFLVIAAAWGVWFLLARTTLGFSLRAVGANARAARYAGISVPLAYVTALFLSGALAGLAGTIQVLGVDRRLYDAFGAGYGYTGIVVALVGRNNPWGVLLAALLFGALHTGSQSMQLTAGVPSQLVDVVQGLIIFFIAADHLVRWLIRRKEAVQA